MSFKRIIITVVAIVVIAFVVIRIGVFVSGQSSKNVTYRTSELDTVVKQIISSHLVSPGSAQFVELIVEKEINTQNQYIAFGDVDSQNSFGGLLRSHFFLVIIDKGGDKQNIDNWTIDQLDLNNLVIIFDGKTEDIPYLTSEENITAGKQLEDSLRRLK